MDLFYLLAALLFVFGLKMLSSPRTARRGNLVAALGMLLAVVVTLAFMGQIGYVTIVAGLVVGALIGTVAALRVPTTALPEMVALFNGSGGLASAVVAIAEYWRSPGAQALDASISIGFAVLIGMVTTTGSLVAWGKLSGKWIPLWWHGKEVNKKGVLEWKAYLKLGNPLTFPLQHALNFVLLVAAITLGVVVALNPGAAWAVVLLILLATVLGVLLTIPIGGADMPVVVSLLNSYSGLAACAAGFVLGNVGLIISGSLVGAAGLILTQIMCKAMNRKLLAVLAGGFGQETAGVGGTSVEGKTVRQMDAEEAAMVLEAAQKVFIIPGYGMAVAQAQHAVAELAQQLQKRGCDVRFGVHPVAGRMPGHMNVLLAEANVPYEQLADLDLNSEMEQCDVALIIGANDVVNPDARRPDSQIAGMPIFDVDRARTVMVCKRSLNPGFAGIENPLFFLDNAVMLFGDAKKMVSGIVTELKSS
ncbi:MAG: NAD(P)(+) transhydrogenase (Re/Si-specific) subunit beta [Phycisphaerales bacterium]|nr:NAD(P)(+) transhydrogenase (Re/Si-specific) subunit beta [Phycisphaerales bacterium]